LGHVGVDAGEEEGTTHDRERHDHDRGHGGQRADLAVGDADFKRECLARLAGLKRAGAMLVFATHDDALALALADEALLLEAGKPLYLGPAGGMPGPGAAEPAEGALARALDRFSFLFAGLRAEGFALREAPPASDEDLLLVHTPAWLARLKANDLSPEEERLLQLPCSRELLPRAWRMAGGTLAAASRALASGLGVYPPGGGHHALPDRGAGFSAVNDIAIAARRLLKDGLVRRPAVIDLDAHQGNGTAFIFPSGEVATFSAHRAGGRPAGRQSSTLDVELPPGAGDAAYSMAFNRVVEQALRRFQPELIVVSAGFDAHWADPLAEMRVSTAGFIAMTQHLDRLADELCGGRLAFVLEGGYDLGALASSVVAVVTTLGGGTPRDELGPPPGGVLGNVDAVLDRVCRLHQL
jgi:acetoin utilization deacetylase AcuC-like enzyme